MSEKNDHKCLDCRGSGVAEESFDPPVDPYCYPFMEVIDCDECGGSGRGALVTKHEDKDKQKGPPSALAQFRKKRNAERKATNRLKCI